MKAERNILIAFFLNLGFSVFEILGGIITGSYAILSDAVHDFCDAISIGLSYLCEKGSKKPPNEQYTFGYVRYSVLGAFITTMMLCVGSFTIIYHAIKRLYTQTQIHYNGMILFAIVGVIVNLIAALLTRKGESINQKAVNLHMLEDVFGWIAILLGAVIMRFTDVSIIDPIISIIYSVWILSKAVVGLKKIIDIFLLKANKNLSTDVIKEELLKINGILDIHHIHSWSIDGINNCISAHFVTNGDNIRIKNEVREHLKELGIQHITIETESEHEICYNKNCGWEPNHERGHCCHFHH